MLSKEVIYHNNEQVAKKATCLIKRVLKYMDGRADHEAALIVEDCRYLLREFEDVDCRTS